MAIVDSCKTLIMKKMIKIVAENCQPHVTEMVNDMDEQWTNPLSSMQTTYKRQKYMHNSMPFVGPIEKVIGNKLVSIVKGNKRIILEKPESYAYIPIIDTIQQLLLNPSTKKSMLTKPEPLKEGLYYDVMDGSFFRNNEFIQSKEYCLLILLFQDAVELCNPLGSRRTKHKTVMFYYTFANFHPRVRSKLSYMKLLACITDKLIKSHGFDCVISELAEEIDKLHNGVQFCVDGSIKTIHAKVLLCLGKICIVL